jgi:nucleoside-diphosphate-sugar epimerase
MIIAITGGSGFVGRRLVERHLAKGDIVKVLSRQSASAVRFPKEIELISADLTCSSKKLNNFVNGVDILYHCAAEVRDQSKMNMVHINGTINLCNAASGRIGHWVQLSSVGVFGPHHSGLITEATKINPVGIYEKTKTKSDQLVMDFAKEGAFTCTILRPSNIFGLTMRNQSIFQLIKMIDRGFFFFIGKASASANYIHVDNVVEALMLCGSAPASRGAEFNLSDHRPLEAFVAVIADELGCPRPTLRVPEQLVRWLSQVFGSISGVLLTSSRINAMTTRSVYSIQKIQKELGYLHRIPMEEGIRQLVRAWKQSK